MSTSLKAYRNYRKYVVISAALVLGGSTYAYARSGRRSGNRRQNSSQNGEEASRELVPRESRGKGKRGKKGGLKSVRYLAGLLLAHMGENGSLNFFLLAILAVVRTLLSNRLARVQGFLFRAAFLKKVPLFARLITENIVLSLAQSAMLSTTKFYTGKLFLHWRQYLTDSIHREYFKNMTYYKLSHVDRRITSPEQRISGDVPKFCKELSDLVLENLNAIIDGTFYTYKMCSYTSYKYPLGILGYVLGAGAITGALSPPFGKLMSEEQQLDGEYRLLNTRLRTHSESVAFYGGQNREASIIMQKFRELVSHHGRMLHTQWWFGMIQDFFLKYCGATWAVFLIIGPFFGGDLRPDNSMEGRAKMLSNMRYHTSVVINLFQAMGTLAGSTRRLARLSGYSDRIKELLDVSKELGRSETDGDSVGGFVNAKKIAFEGVKVVTPAGSVLVEDLNLEVKPGCNLLITGPNGSGKSSLFRVLGGLWPLVAGHIEKPGLTADLGHEIFYVPQRPYTAPGTLRDQLIYPRTSTKEQQLLSNDRMRDLLAIVDLEYLLDRYPEDEEVNWGEELSLGEQQRLGMARLFYHQPAFAILDECTSAVTTDMEERFCERVRGMGTTCVTISHRPALVAFHDTVLALDGEGGWTVHYKEVQPGSNADNQLRITEVEGEESTSGRQTDSAAVTRSFLDSGKKERSPKEAIDSYFGPVLANSPPIDPDLSIPRIPRLKIVPQSLKYRLHNLSRVFFPRLFSRQGGLLGLLFSLVVGRTWLSDRIASLNGSTVSNVLHQDKAGFMRLLGISVLQSSASAIVAPSLRHLTASLSLSWRVRLTRYLAKLYFQHNAYYKAVHLSEGGMDADQRITQDVEKLCGDVAGLVTGMVKPIVDIFWFTLRVKLLTGNRGVAILYAYMFLGLGFLRTVTPDFGGLTSQEQAYESNFRFLHSRLRTHAESVAFFGGGDREKNVLQGHFNKLMTHLRLLHRKRWTFGIVDEFVTKQLPHQVTWFLSLLYALDAPGNRSDTAFQGKLAHDLRFLASVVSQSFLAFGDILELYRKFLELGGGITRVSELLELLKQAQHDIRSAEGGIGMGRVGSLSVISEDHHPAARDDIVFHNVDVITPNQKLLAHRLSFRIRPRSSMLVTGPNGSGKSSLFRVLGGLWPLVSGKITMPGLPFSALALHGEDGEVLTTGLHSHDIFYVPQRPYMALGTLRDQIVYPLTVEEAMTKVMNEFAREPVPDDEAQPGVSPMMALDERLKSILKTVRLSYLLEREGGWDVTKNWADILSLGEQQRLGMARLFFHRPKFGILDECTNATSVDVEESLYRHAQMLGITVVTISQRPALIPFHSTELRLIDGEGGWEFRAIEHGQSTPLLRQFASV